MRITATRKLGFDAAHRVLRHESKCSTLHGHRYTAEVTCSAELDHVGRVIDFGVLKSIIGAWIDETLDHTTIAGEEDAALIAFCEAEHEGGKRAPFVMSGEPTAENIARLIFEESARLLLEAGSPVEVVSVRLWETPSCFADCAMS